MAIAFKAVQVSGLGWRRPATTGTTWQGVDGEKRLGGRLIRPLGSRTDGSITAVGSSITYVTFNELGRAGLSLLAITVGGRCEGCGGRGGGMMGGTS